jgi:hypothetical protein
MRTTPKQQLRGDFAVSNASIATDHETDAKPSWLHVVLVNSPYILIYGATIWLVAMTDRDSAKAATYWQYFVPIVGLVSVIGGWGKATESKGKYLMEQVLHWGALLLVIYLLFLPDMEQFLNAESHGFVIAYMLGLAAILSGIYLDWKMAVFGLFLLASAVGIGFLDENALLITLIGVGIAAILVTLLIRRSGLR